MNKFTTSLATVAALLAGGLVAVPAPAYAAKADQPGVLHVYDLGAMFTKAGIDKAKGTMGDVQFDQGLTLTIDTESTPPANKIAPGKDASDGEKAKFFETWAKEQASGDKAKGIYVLVCRSPGYVQVIAGKTTRDRGFSPKDEQKLRDILLTSFRDSSKAKQDGKSEEEQFKIRDEALAAAVDYVISDLKDTVVATGGTGNTTNTQTTKKISGPGGYGGIGGWICLGLTILLCVWLVIGLLRALTGGGGGGGGGYGGGGGGGGFGMGLMGGLFGAMAGMYLYNSMMGTHYGSDAYAGDNSNNSGDNGGGADTSGDGDFSGDAGAGGSYDDSGSGGDTGGGGDYGGDTGGGGDYGGGGDDTGGGGDFGGGGDYGGDF